MEQNETLENDDVLEFDYTGTDQAGNLAAMAENLSQEEAAAAIEAIEKVRRERVRNVLMMRYGISGRGLTQHFCRS